MGRTLVCGAYVCKEMDKTSSGLRNEKNPIPLVNGEKVFPEKREAERYVKGLGYWGRHEYVFRELSEDWTFGYMRHTTYPVDVNQSSICKCVFVKPQGGIGMHINHNASYRYTLIIVYGEDLDRVEETFKREVDFVALAYG